MSQPLKVTWTTSRGDYTYEVYPLGTKFNSVPGNYVFAYLANNGRWTATYVGQTNDLGERLSNHPKQSCAVSKGATHILVRVNANSRDRLIEEEAMIQNCQPPCNSQLK